eukprot:TRINITY_DN108_c0_g2_i2.p1 TRINITY_DN108_c0_g2~~TRINITY_DN108_c0_g2_i2.p1  ORF type:complete len:1762 (+),score=195.97 TRINITY_DN108_c0_g2_i2:104-5389(+)
MAAALVFALGAFADHRTYNWGYRAPPGALIDWYHRRYSGHTPDYYNNYYYNYYDDYTAGHPTGSPTEYPTEYPTSPTGYPTTWPTTEFPTMYPTDARAPCRSIHGGALMVKGLTMQRANGIYMRHDSKKVNGEETYWLNSELLFMYYCSHRWLINDGTAYMDARRIAACEYLVEASMYPTMHSAMWYAMNDTDRTMAPIRTDQPDGEAVCVDPCDVWDGSGPSNAYPCTCGTTWCSSMQSCTAHSSSCSECKEIRVAGLDGAVRRAALHPRLLDHVSDLATSSLHLDGLWKRDDCKRISGRATYWYNDWYLYRCAYKRWAIADNTLRSWDKQDHQADCWSIVRTLASDMDMSPVGTSRWEAHDGREFLQLEHDHWHAVLTCPVTHYTPPCHAGPWPPWATLSPAVPMPAPQPPLGLVGCESTLRGFRIDGDIRGRPCRRVENVNSWGHMRLWACRDEMVLCNGDPDRSNPAVCRTLGNYGCHEGVYDSSFRHDGRRVYLACRGGIRSCRFDPEAGSGVDPISDCVHLQGARCPPGSYEQGVAVTPEDSHALVMGCWSQFANDEGVLVCHVNPDGRSLDGDCVRKGASPCAAYGRSYLMGISFDSAGGFMGGCRDGGYTYCGFSVEHGPSSCSMTVLGHSPCPGEAWINGITELPSGRVAVGCGFAGARICTGTAVNLPVPTCDTYSCTAAATVAAGSGPQLVISEPPYHGRNEEVWGCEVRITSGQMNGDELGIPQWAQDEFEADAHWDNIVLLIRPRHPAETISVEHCGALLSKVYFTIDDRDESSHNPRTMVELTWMLLLAEGVKYNPHNQHYYKRYTQKKTWREAEAACLDVNLLGYDGYLATITDQAEHSFLRDMNHGDAGQGGGPWLGGREGADGTRPGEWSWETGCESDSVFWRDTNAVMYANWHQGSPRGTPSADGVLLNKVHGKWVPYPLHERQPYFCEWGGLCPAIGRPIVPLRGVVVITLYTASRSPTLSPSVPEEDCRTVHGGALKISGLTIRRINGVYMRRESKTVHGRETYWLHSEGLFIYYCESRWLILQGHEYAHGHLGACKYIVEISKYPTSHSAHWAAMNDTLPGDPVWTPQPYGSATCVRACDVSDGSAPSSMYPCTCGTTACVSDQHCTAHTSTCSECNEIRVSGLDEAIRRAALHPRLLDYHISDLATTPLGVDGLWKRDDCKRISGRETYWRDQAGGGPQTGDWYLYRCVYGRWAMAKHTRRPWESQDHRADCWSLVRTLPSETEMQPLGASRWEAWDGREFLRIEHNNWHTVLTCPHTTHIPPCAAGPWPPGPTPHPAVALPAPEPSVAFGGCESTPNAFNVEGRIQWRPCDRVENVRAWGNMRLWSCISEIVLCTGDPDPHHPASCTSLGNLGCDRIYDTAFRHDGRRVFVACRGGIRSCEWHPSRTPRHTIDNCLILGHARCPPGSYEQGIAIPPSHPDILTVGCWSQWSGDEGVMLCPMNSEGTRLRGDCLRRGESPCGAAGLSSMMGIDFDSAGGFVAGCRQHGYAYCGFSPEGGPSSCSMDVLGDSPCPANGWTNGITELPSGATAVACGFAGIRICRWRRPTESPTWSPTHYPTAYPTRFTRYPTYWPTRYPTWPTHYPTTGYPTGFPTRTGFPTKTGFPTRTGFPSRPPSGFPTGFPKPTGFPTRYPQWPTGFPSRYPVWPTGFPSRHPSGFPTRYPVWPTGFPSRHPTGFPTRYPVWPTGFPTRWPTHHSGFPTSFPTYNVVFSEGNKVEQNRGLAQENSGSALGAANAEK